ncbi:MAG: DinB family protein [Gemmatimonadota bacterium]|nr:DinB family protein [Gemmatimonadota bacterium]
MSVKDVVTGDLGTELDNTRRMLASVPDDRLDWQPHEKSWPIGGLARHISNLPMWATMVLVMDELDLSRPIPPSEPPSSIAEVLEIFDRNRLGLEAALGEATDEGLQAMWTLRKGEHVVMSAPRAVVLRQAGISHMIHHRGQLSLYLRLLDVAVPETYGPTQDSETGD